MCVLEFIRHALVGNMPMLVIKRQSLTRIFFALNFDSVRVVVPQYYFATGRVQSQRVPDSVRDVLTGRVALRPEPGQGHGVF